MKKIKLFLLTIGISLIFFSNVQAISYSACFCSIEIIPPDEVSTEELYESLEKPILIESTRKEAVGSDGGVVAELDCSGELEQDGVNYKDCIQKETVEEGNCCEMEVTYSNVMMGNKASPISISEAELIFQKEHGQKLDINYNKKLDRWKIFVPVKDNEECMDLCKIDKSLTFRSDHCKYLSDVTESICKNKQKEFLKGEISDSSEATTETEGGKNIEIDPFAGVKGIDEYKQLEVTSIPDLMGNLIKTALGFIGSIALVMFVFGGLLWMTAMGNSEQQKKAMNMILWSSLGVLVILSSYVIVSFVLRAFGIS